MIEPIALWHVTVELRNPDAMVHVSDVPEAELNGMYSMLGIVETRFRVRGDDGNMHMFPGDRIAALIAKETN